MTFRRCPRGRVVACLLAFTCLLAAPVLVQAESRSSEGVSDALASIWDNEFGKFHLNARLRYEYADQDGFDSSNALTLRTRLGFGTRSWQGLSALVEGAGNVAFDRAGYWSGVGSSSDDTLIADPEFLDLNRAWGRYAYEPWGTALKVGRSRWKLDDDRFIGNVGWRQNEQTFDSVRLDSSFGQEKLMATYGFNWRVKRIWGDRSSPPGRKDWDTKNHFVHAHYDFMPELGVSVFDYYLDINQQDLDSSNSVGYRLTGRAELGESWSVAYAQSFAWQTDAADNPTDYDAFYYAFEAVPAWKKAGGAGLGYEVLGSDDGEAQFRTPLATGHKFNGFADAFLDNGGPGGLRDLYALLAPKLPWKLQGRIIYHWFWTDDGGGQLGQELDLVISKAITEHISVLAKAAWFDGRSDGPADRNRLWLQVEIKL